MTGSRGPLSKEDQKHGRVLPASGRDGPVPELPDREWRPETLVWWEGVWRSPMATQFVESDRHELARLALLVDEFMRSPSPELGAEIRMQGALHARRIARVPALDVVESGGLDGLFVHCCAGCRDAGDQRKQHDARKDSLHVSSHGCGNGLDAV